MELPSVASRCGRREGLVDRRGGQTEQDGDAVKIVTLRGRDDAVLQGDRREPGQVAAVQVLDVGPGTGRTDGDRDQVVRLGRRDVPVDESPLEQAR
ncbi:hypothetical protein ACIA5C_41710 [Actinoplanes sp. NPDC051343]|uniref:hypothetical protein n=1 Tax=Actinoplanes sp. NPDC051343 TaxID=3363906 RepID=UPI0037B613AA